MRLIVGLGNPGSKYKNTRHNVGFLAADFLVEALGIEFNDNKKLNTQITQGKIGREKIFIIKPTTYMNNSGHAVQAVRQYYKIPVNKITVIHDDKDIIIGQYKIQSNRGAAGHNGVQSIINSLKTKDFTRIRIGIKPEKEIKNTAKFVLDKMNKSEKEKINCTIQQIKEEILF